MIYMKVVFTERFKKRFQKLPLKIQRQFEKRLAIFIQNPSHPSVKNHPLKGYLVGFRAFSVTGDYRVVFKFLNHETAKLVDIGTHTQVYE